MADKQCPVCSHIAEATFPPDVHCPTCGRRRSLFLAAFQKSQQSEITDERILEIARSMRWGAGSVVPENYALAFARAVLKEGK